MVMASPFPVYVRFSLFIGLCLGLYRLDGTMIRHPFHSRMAICRILLFIVLVGCYLSVGSSSDGDFWRWRKELSLDEQSSLSVEEVKNWPGLAFLGQVSAVAVDGAGNLHLFHRADRVWDYQTFGPDARLSDPSPIPNDTVLVLDSDTGDLLFSWGANRFYMPHGLTVDHHGNTWVTDVGLHQVMKFPAGELNPELVLGEALVPGADNEHFCQPTDVAVSPLGYFFVADGYCNSRILMFADSGRLLRKIGTADRMNVPHSLALVPQLGAFCVADRENARVLCYAFDGSTVLSLAGFGRVYAIDARGKEIFAVRGVESPSTNHGVVIDMESGLPKVLFGPQKGFSAPHDLAVSPDGKSMFVSEIDTSSLKRVYKFRIFY